MKTLVQKTSFILGTRTRVAIPGIGIHPGVVCLSRSRDTGIRIVLRSLLITLKNDDNVRINNLCSGKYQYFLVNMLG